MVKTKSAPVLNTHKLTEYFGKCSGPSSSQPQATPPAPSSQASRTSAPRSSVKAKMSSLTPTQAPFQSSSKMGSRQLTLLLQRPGKKENAPPPRSRPQDPEVISISSASDSQTHISISTDAATHISISSTSAISLGSSVVEINAPDHAHLKVKQERQCLGTVSIPSSPARSRRSPRLQLKGESSNGTVKRETSWDPKRITSDDEEVNLDDAKDVVYVIPKSFQSSAKADAVTPTHSPTKPQTPSSRKRTRLIEDLPAHDGAADDEEVIPSSQSDERDELSLTRPPRKFHKEIYESVRAWRANSQPDTSLETDDNGWIADKVGQGSDSHIDADIGLDFGSPFHSPAPRTPVSANCKRDAPLEDVQGGSEQPSATTIPDHHFTSNFSATPPPDRFSTATPFFKQLSV
ncbi:hypothetical protein EW145_g5544 [Phellinidium pouzarii]|uniref:Uncharacterized protein n=1 Tax=Phellinidium pouzarii TaxID=167371 RepID=A0A4S4KZL8_9AGAM|nr:hypothetical protein EW145_g5544 [Phellinidium pouzarii]